MKKALSVITVLALICTLFTVAFASGEAAVISDYSVITESVTYPDGVTIEEGAGYGAEDGYTVIMTVDGMTLTQAAGTYAGEVVFEVVPLTLSNDGSSDYQTQSILTKNGDELITADSALNGTYDEAGISGADITADEADMSVVTVVNGEYEVTDSTFHILQTGNHESGGNDFTGDGCAIAVTGGSLVTVDGVDITGDGVTRTSIFGGLSTHDNYPTVYVANSNLTATGDDQAEDCAVWVLGLHGVVRTLQFDDYYDIYYFNDVIKSFGWACLSVDGTETPTADDLVELNDAYVEGEGYANASGEIMELNEFAVAATGLTDDYLAALAAVESTDDLKALDQTNDYSLYYYAGKNTIVDSELSILDIDTTGTGYSSYSIGANMNVYSGCTVNASYGNVEANEYASSAYVNGTVVNATKSIVMCHSNAGGITFVSDAVLNAGEIAFVYKGTGEGYTQDNLDENASSSEMIMGATGSNLYVRNTEINAPVLVLAFDSDDPGSLGGTEITIDDSIAPKDEGFDVTNDKNWGPASTMWSGGAGYNYNEAVTVYFEDCNGETALNGDIYNAHQFTSKNMIVTLDNCEITGAITSGYVQHDVDIILSSMSSTDEDYEEDGVRYGNRENLGDVECFAAETVNNGVILTLKNGTVWNVTETSYVSVLNVGDDCVINGIVTVLDDGCIMIEPADADSSASVTEEEEAAPSAEGELTEADYQEYLHEWLIAENEVNDTMTDEILEDEFMPLIYAGDYETFPAEMLWNGMLENGSPMTLDEFLAQ